MTDLLNQVTPLTKGIIWLPDGSPETSRRFYREIDYLLNGLLTATLKQSVETSQVLVGENFGESFFVFVGLKTNAKELTNFLDLIKTQLAAETNLLLIDETNSFSQLKSSVPTEVFNRIQPIQ
jgi:SRSO17 transposase